MTMRTFVVRKPISYSAHFERGLSEGEIVTCPDSVAKALGFAPAPRAADPEPEKPKAVETKPEKAKSKPAKTTPAAGDAGSQE